MPCRQRMRLAGVGGELRFGVMLDGEGFWY